MRKSCVVILAALVVSIPACYAGDGETVAFDSQASHRGNLRTGVPWVAVFLNADAERVALAQLTLTAGTQVVNHTHSPSGHVDALVAGMEIPSFPALENSYTLERSTELAVSFDKHTAPVLILKGARVEVQTHRSTGALVNKPDGVSPQAYAPEVMQPPWGNGKTMGMALVTAFSQPEGQLSVHVEGIQSILWSGARVSCRGESRCPDGGSWHSEDRVWTKSNTTLQQYSYEEILPGEGSSVTLVGGWNELIGGAAALDLSLDGDLSLPGASSEGPCEICARQNSVELRGNLSLRNVQPGPDGRLQGQIAGTVVSGRLDEQVLGIDIPLAGGIATTSALLGGALLTKYLIAALISRRHKEPLANPKRALVYQYVVDHPGVNFRDVVRGSALASGTVRHHLTVLKRSGLIAERPHGVTLRFFENHGKFDQSWKQLVALRDDGQEELVGWLKAHAGSEQKQVIEGMAASFGWSRSTTQHRLGRLVAAGAVTMTMHGRRKVYVVAPVPALAPRPGVPPQAGQSGGAAATAAGAQVQPRQPPVGS